MDWLKLFALLVAVASVQVTAERPKKKIRIHLPQNVKHIHHHKKIYITNHPAASQYAPAYLPGVKGAVAVPSNVARPAVASIVPSYVGPSVYDESRGRLSGVSAAASKLLPLYRARGHYGPHHSVWDEQEYDLAPPLEPTNIYAPSGTSTASVGHPPKRIKILKLLNANELPRKKVGRKVKPKSVVHRGRPQTQPLLQPDDEHPVSSFHEQFYSDLAETGTIRKIKKPPRIEKIIDGDTEHIHTYSEEHIHKVVFDDDSKLTGVVGVNPIGSMSALTATHPLIPIKNAQTLVAFPTNTFSDLAVVGSMGTPSHLEYAAYNPRDVTHDHIFHDHGEIPSSVQVTKETLRLPPKVSYNSQGLRLGGDKKYHSKYTKIYSKPTKPTSDFSYYESIYSPKTRPKKVPRPTIPTPIYATSPEVNLEDHRPISKFRFKENRKTKPRQGTTYYGSGNIVPNFQQHQASVPAPFSVSSTVVHDYDSKNYGGLGPSPAGFSKFKDPLVDFKDSYVQDFDYDTFASSSNVFTSEDKTDPASSDQGKTGKKSISTQNISFGGQDSQTFVDHLAASSNAVVSVSEGHPTAIDQYSDFDETMDSASPTPYTIKETSPAHQYYTAMALKALHGEQAEASNDNLQYVEAPTLSSIPTEQPVATTTSLPTHYYIQTSDIITPEPDFISVTRQSKKRREKNNVNSKKETRQRYNAVFKGLLSPQGLRHIENKYSYLHPTESEVRGNLKYGDKI